MVDRYYRKIEDVENDIENAMQISSNLLKLKGYDNDLGKISTNTGSISTNSGLISVNKKNISSNSGLISTNTGSISTNSGLISANKKNISSNLSKITNLIIVNDIFNDTFVISRFSTSWSNNRIFYRTINSKFTTNGIIKIDAKYDYVYDKNYTLNHIYRFYNNKKQFKKIVLDHDRSSNVINDKFEIQGIDSTEIEIAIYFENNTDNKKIALVGNNTIQINYIETNSKLDINKNNISANLEKINDNSGLISTNTSSIESNLEKINDNSGLTSTNTLSTESNLEKINDNSGLISSNTSSIESNLEKIDANISDITSNLEKINNNKDDIIALQNSNVKAFYNLDKIFIYDIEKGDQNVNKDNHFHIKKTRFIRRLFNKLEHN